MRHDVHTSDDSECLVVAGITESDAQAGGNGETVDVLARNIKSDGDGEEGTLNQTKGVHHTARMMSTLLRMYSKCNAYRL